jgi:POT family proton-dependent oligopeptide transporter
MPNLYLQIALFSIGIGIVVALMSFKSRIWERAGINQQG